MDTRYYWLQDREAQNQYKFQWQPGMYNIGDYYTKHHPPKHHNAMRPCILNHPNHDYTGL